MHERKSAAALIRRSFAVGVACAVAAFGLTACSRDSSSTGLKGGLLEGGTLKLATKSKSTDANPYSQTGISLSGFAYDSLIYVDSRGDVVSGLASGWTTSQSAATFTLRKDVTCSDGTKLTAEDVAASLTYASDPKNQLVGARGVLPSVPITAKGDNSTGVVEVKTSSPYPFIPETVGVLPIVCPAGLKNPKSLEGESHGTGPYILKSFKPAGPYEFTVRAGYTWGPDGATTAEPGVPTKIDIQVVTNESTATNRILRGDLNISEAAGPEMTRLERRRDLFSVEIPLLVGLLFFNERSGHPTSDPDVRRALVAALDVQKLANVAAGGKGKPAQDLMATNAVCHADIAKDNLPTGDAARMLADAGWIAGNGGTRTKGGKPLTIKVYTSASLGSTLPSVVELMAEMWKAVGVDVQIKSVDLNALMNVMFTTTEFDALVGASAGFHLPAEEIPFFSGPTPPKGLNFAAVNNPDYAQLAKKALVQPGKEGCPTWNAAFAAFFKDADMLPIADGIGKIFGYKTEFATTSITSGDGLIPTSIRMHK